MKFSKYQGTGNDFILIDNRTLHFKKDSAFIAQLCHRRFGIGADGLILLEEAEHPEEDFTMRYYNADGGESTMCGNGGRCIVSFAHHLGIIENRALFSAIDGRHKAHLQGSLISLQMREVSGYKKIDKAYCIDSGSPHYIRFVSHPEQIDVDREGRRIRNSPHFKREGINVNFVAPEISPHPIRTYERGVEAETYSCGTGVTATALALSLAGVEKGNTIAFKTLGGNLSVSFERRGKNFHNIWLAGPTALTFTGSLERKSEKIRC